MGHGPNAGWIIGYQGEVNSFDRNILHLIRKGKSVAVSRLVERLCYGPIK